MPEIPEVTRLANVLHPALWAARIEAVTINPFRNLLKNCTAAEFEKALIGCEFRGVSNYSKYVIMSVGDKTPDRLMVSHFKWTGWWQCDWKETIPHDFLHPTSKDNIAKYARLGLKTSKGMLYYTDPRAMGSIWLFNDLAHFEKESPHKRLGPQVTDDQKFTWDFFSQQVWWNISKRKGANMTVADFLIEQSLFSGIGNYLRCEIMWEAQICPLYNACALNMAQKKRLWDAIQIVLKKAFDWPGHDWWNVFDRAKMGCNRKCGGEVTRMAYKERGIYYCPKCQAAGST